MNPIVFRVRIDCPELCKYFPASTDKMTYEYDCKLEYSDIDNIKLKVFFKSEESLDRRFMQWAHDYEGNIFSRLSVLEIFSSKDLIEIDLGNSHYKSMKSAEYFNDQYSYLTIGLYGIRLVYKNREAEDSKFYLNKTSFNLIELGYQYNNKIYQDFEEYTWAPRLRFSEAVPFNDIKFFPEFRFYTLEGNNGEEVRIKKEPRIRVESSNLSEIEIRNHVRALCNLYSFYTQKSIECRVSQIYTNGHFYYEVSRVSEEVMKFPHGMFLWKFFQNPMNLIRNVDSGNILMRQEFVSSIIKRFLYALQSQGETQFMLLFNILEQLRNQYILEGKIEKEKAGSPPNIRKVKEEFSFIYGSDRVRKELKKILNQVTDLLQDSEKEMFDEEMHHKISMIKLMGLANQYESLFQFLKISPNEYGLDFSKVKSLRDSIFHGRPIDEDADFLEYVNYHTRMPIFIGTLMLRYFGIENLDNITKYPRQD